jgi:hypothetical protein
VLYRTRLGTFFVAGQSGACGRWRRCKNGHRNPGNGIEVVSDTQARQLLEKANGPVESLFDVIDGEGQGRIAPSTTQLDAAPEAFSERRAKCSRHIQMHQHRPPSIRLEER